MLLVLILLLEQGLESGDNLLDYGVTNTERAAAQAPSNPLDANNADDFDLKLTRLRTKQTPEQAKADINAILDGFQFDTLKVTKSTLEEAILQLQEQAEALQLTVDRKQIERLAPKVLETSITLDLQQVPLREALKFLTMLAGATFRVEPDGVVISIDDKQVQRNAEVRKPLPPGFYTKTYPKNVWRQPKPCEAGMALVTQTRTQPKGEAIAKVTST